MDVSVVIIFAAIVLVVIVVKSLFSDDHRHSDGPQRTLRRPSFPRRSAQFPGKIHAPLPANNTDELLRVKVRYVIDGDTIIVSTFYTDDVRIRLSAIDCPEDGQDWGDNAKAALINLIGNRHVHIESLHGV